VALNLDSEPVRITCPHCNHKFEETISRLTYHPKHYCPSCKKNVSVNLLALHTALESSRRSMDDLIERLINSRP